MSSPLQDLLDALEAWDKAPYFEMNIRGYLKIAYRAYQDAPVQNTTELDLANVIDSRTFTVGNTQNKVDAIMQLLNGGNCERAK